MSTCCCGCRDGGHYTNAHPAGAHGSGVCGAARPALAIRRPTHRTLEGKTRGRGVDFISQQVCARRVQAPHGSTAPRHGCAGARLHDVHTAAGARTADERRWVGGRVALLDLGDESAGVTVDSNGRNLNQLRATNKISWVIISLSNSLKFPWGSPDFTFWKIVQFTGSVN